MGRESREQLRILGAALSADRVLMLRAWEAQSMLLPDLELVCS